NLGLTLGRKGQRDDALAEYREAIRLKDDYAEAHCNLGLALRDKGQFQQAVEELRRGHQLGSRGPRWPYPSPQWLQETEPLLALDTRLPTGLGGGAPPADAAEMLALARLCVQYKKLHAAAVRFYRDAFAAEPKLADDPRAAHRYDA